MSSKIQDPLDYLFGLFDRLGSDGYYGEAISQTEHALQTALAAERGGAEDATVAAGLLHDIGHLLDNKGEEGRLQEVDRYHEQIGARWLARFFPPAVTEPIRLHVDAKRYLCATEPDYQQNLSGASTQSLALQGGVMSDLEAEVFAANPFAASAIALRSWDDQAKQVGVTLPDLTTYRPLLRSLLS